MSRLVSIISKFRQFDSTMEMAHEEDLAMVALIGFFSLFTILILVL